MLQIVVVSREEDFPVDLHGVEVITARQYLKEEHYAYQRHVRVFNLCRSYRYQAAGYYVSLLAEARGHRIVPSVTTIQDFKTRSILRPLSDEVDALIQKSLAYLTSQEFVLSIYFGKNMAAHYNKLCGALYNLFESPFLRVTFVKSRRWQIQSVSPTSFHEIPESHLLYVYEFAKQYFSVKRRRARKKDPPLYSMAILTDAGDATPPSDEVALKRFTRAAENAGIRVQRIGRGELARLGDHDALFIRATTSVNDYTYRFSRRAAAEGLVVVDDPESILRCGNKVFLAELLHRNRVPSPRTVVVHRDNVDYLQTALGYPFVLKLPDSSFSLGVTKIFDNEGLHEALGRFFPKSDFLVAQEFMPTDFDWRIGVLDRKPLFACKYYMAANHWQIYDWSTQASRAYGRWETVSIEEAPRRVVECAVRAASLIGGGLYGVDLKVVKGRCFVIEINDNPSIEAGVEDKILKSTLYEHIMAFFVQQLQRQPQRERVPR